MIPQANGTPTKSTTSPTTTRPARPNGADASATSHHIPQELMLPAENPEAGSPFWRAPVPEMSLISLMNQGRGSQGPTLSLPGYEAFSGMPAPPAAAQGSLSDLLSSALNDIEDDEEYAYGFGTMTSAGLPPAQ